jgi:Carboxypeptidase regulatory-like domain
MLLKQTCARLAAIAGFIILLSQAGCKKNDDINDNKAPGLEPPITTNDAVKVTATVSGSVIDENNQPVANASVTSGTYTATTDAMGNFVFSNIAISKANGHVTVLKQGYFKGIRSFVTEAGKNNYVKIQLIKQVVTGTVTASAGGVINTLTGASITFPANSFVTTAGAAYSGTVFVYAHWIDPTAPNLPLVVPGDLRGIDSSNGEYLLKSYGMVGAEFQDNSGNLLKLAPGKTAAISFPIPASLQSTAPSTIPLWHFDEAAARWKQEGTATKNGNNYIGQVNKFSFWNVDVPANFITLDLRLINSTNNLPLANTLVKVTSLATNTSAYDFTNDSGYVSGYVPKNENLKLEVITGTACNTNTVVYTQNIGPYTANSSLGNISVTIPANLVISFTATLVNCSNQPVTNGYISLSLAGGTSTIAYSNATGAVSFSLLYCGGSTSYSYTGVDLSNGNYSTVATGSATGNNVSLGTITACGNTINTSGVYIAGAIDDDAAYWKDGVPVLLTNINSTSNYNYAYATAVTVYNNDVYVLGAVEDSTVNGSISAIKLWKNGVATSLTSGITYAEAYGLDVYNGDVYVSGYEHINGTDVAKVWKNGVATVLTKDTFDIISVGEMKVINGDVYVCGAGYRNNSIVTEKPLYWKNGVIYVLSNSGGMGNADVISESNGDIYIAGYDAAPSQPGKSVFWKNGVKTELAITPGYGYVSSNAIFAVNGDHYIAGSHTHTSTGYYVNASYWKNNSPVLLTNGSSPGITYDFYDIFVKGNIIYTVGEQYQSSTGASVPLYFQNNVPVPLTGTPGSQNLYPTAIFVK